MVKLMFASTGSISSAENEVLWDLDLNSISMINLVMAVGLVVDYSTSVRWRDP